VLPFVFSVFNARLDKTSNTPNLTREIRLFKDGKMISSGSPTPIDTNGVADLKHIIGFGVLRITDQVEPGEYLLQVIVRDLLANRVGSQSMNFEVLPKNK
jgi:hypothetical protein